MGLSFLTRRLYLVRSEPAGLICPDRLETASSPKAQAVPGTRYLVYLSIPIHLIAPIVLWANLSRYVATRSFGAMRLALL
jgi:hypothetical protein